MPIPSGLTQALYPKQTGDRNTRLSRYMRGRAIVHAVRLSPEREVEWKELRVALEEIGAVNFQRVLVRRIWLRAGKDHAMATVRAWRDTRDTQDTMRCPQTEQTVEVEAVSAVGGEARAHV